ncbi:BTB/POZ and MATH domain-containing protein 3-like [Carex rostrata]
MATAQNDLIFVPGSTTFDIPQFTTLHTLLEKNQCIQSESFKLGGYDWVIQFYPKGTSESNTGCHSEIFIKVLNANEECSVICTPLRWDWITSTWVRGKPETMMGLQRSGDTARSGFNYATKYLEVSKFCKASSKFLKDDTIRIKFDLLVTPNPTPLKPDFDEFLLRNLKNLLSGAI